MPADSQYPRRQCPVPIHGRLRRSQWSRQYWRREPSQARPQVPPSDRKECPRTGSSLTNTSNCQGFPVQQSGKAQRVLVSEFLGQQIRVQVLTANRPQEPARRERADRCRPAVRGRWKRAAVDHRVAATRSPGCAPPCVPGSATAVARSRRRQDPSAGSRSAALRVFPIGPEGCRRPRNVEGHVAEPQVRARHGLAVGNGMIDPKVRPFAGAHHVGEELELPDCAGPLALVAAARQPVSALAHSISSSGRARKWPKS
jgi:hypothetical protein